MYKIIFFKSRQLEKNLSKVKKSGNKPLLEQKLISFAENPLRNINVKKIIAPKYSVFRLRVGNWRIFYDMDSKNQIIIIYRIISRNKAY